MIAQTILRSHIFQHRVVPSDFTFDVGVTSLDISKYLNGNPLGILAKSTSTEGFLWNFELWHEKMLRETPDVLTETREQCKDLNL